MEWPEYVCPALVQSSRSTVLEWDVSTIVSPHPVGPHATATVASNCRQMARLAKVREYNCVYVRCVHEGAGSQMRAKGQSRHSVAASTKHYIQQTFKHSSKKKETNLQSFLGHIPR